MDNFETALYKAVSVSENNKNCIVVFGVRRNIGANEKILRHFTYAYIPCGDIYIPRREENYLIEIKPGRVVNCSRERKKVVKNLERDIYNRKSIYKIGVGDGRAWLCGHDMLTHSKSYEISLTLRAKKSRALYRSRSFL
jgi:hypothetical protein